jgi:hypothetical protein
MTGYGRGFGRLFAQHGLSRARFNGLLARKMIGASVRRARGLPELAHADMAFVRSARQGYQTWR